MKKIAFIMIIAALWMIPIIASADDDWNDFQGTYRMVASGSCIHSQNGYYDPDSRGWIIAKPGVVYAGTTVLDGVWVFNDNGTGTYSQTLHATVTPPPRVPPPAHGPPVEVAGGIRVFKANDAEFTYTIDEGVITVIDAGGLELKGSISIDWLHMTLVSADNVQNFGVAPFWYTICNTARTLIKID
jgi:hypothetical protein